MKLSKKISQKALLEIVFLPILITSAIFIFRPVIVEECCTIAGVQTSITPKIIAPESSISEDKFASPDMITSVQVKELAPIPPLLIFVTIYLITLIITILLVRFSIKRKNVPPQTHM